MLVCLACYEDRLASLLETAASLRLYRVADGGAAYAGECPLPAEGLPGVPGALRLAGVDRLVCGGATCRCVEMIAAAGIRVDPWIAGRVDEVLAALIQGRVAGLRTPGICPRRGLSGRAGRRRP
jgi:predicted Fe-Mo cluster-binding NifX family protein